jgi:hypothetical protein
VVRFGQIQPQQNIGFDVLPEPAFTPIRRSNEDEALCANMTETLASLFITVEGQEGTSHGKGYEQARPAGGQRP